ncbi:hypothetical protein GF351_03235 [Candidatus Woesearchaeota archaeon]|nr:hypothetical protein [Candidatus Woesearchaeota archaeon]
MTKRGRRGSSQVDWAMSLAIFLLYLAWFFVFVRPMIEPERKVISMAEIVEEGFAGDAEWTVTKVPVILASEHDSLYTPVIIELPYDWEEGTFAVTDRYYDYDNGRLMFLANLSENRSSTVYIVHSSQNYTQPYSDTDISATPRQTTNRYLDATFYDNMLYSLAYDGNEIIDDMELLQNNEEAEVVNSSFSQTKINSKNRLISGNFNHTTYIFSMNRRIVNLVDPKPYEEFDLTIQAELYGYTGYFADNLNFGDINFSYDRCETFHADYLDFYTSTHGLAFVFDSNATCTFCYDNSSVIDINLTIPVGNATEYWIVPHQGSYSNNSITDMGYFSAGFGLVSEEHGLGTGQLDNISRMGFSELRERWEFPYRRDFQLNISNSTSHIWGYQYGTPGYSDNVYVKETNTWLLDKYADQQYVTLRISTW